MRRKKSGKAKARGRMYGFHDKSWMSPQLAKRILAEFRGINNAQDQPIIGVLANIVAYKKSGFVHRLIPSRYLHRVVAVAAEMLNTGSFL